MRKPTLFGEQALDTATPKAKRFEEGPAIGWGKASFIVRLEAVRDKTASIQKLLLTVGVWTKHERQGSRFTSTAARDL